MWICVEKQDVLQMKSDNKFEELTVKMSKMKMSKKGRGRWRHFLPFNIFIFDIFSVNR